MSDIKIQGKEDIERLLQKQKTWDPPESLDEFLKCVRAVIETSKYTDTFIREDADVTLGNLRAFLHVKAGRVAMHPDIEECVDAAAYAYMIYHLLLERDGESDHD